MTISDESAIVRLSFDYADAVRAHDPVAWGATWADDAVWVLGPGREVQGRAAIVGLWRTAMARYERVVQVYLAHSFDIDGDHASGRIQLLELNDVADGTKKVLAGHYDDTYVRRDGRWLFASRRLVQYYNGAPDLSGVFSPPAPNPPGAGSGRPANP